MEKRIKLSGIQRSMPQNSSVDGGCQEIINMRYRDGAWRPIPPKESSNMLYTYNGNAIYFKYIKLHQVEDGINEGEPNYIGYCPEQMAIFWINPVTQICTMIDYVYPLMDGTDNITNIVFLKRTMIVTSAQGLLTFFYSNKDGVKSYARLTALPTPAIQLYSSNSVKATDYTEDVVKLVQESGTASLLGVLGIYYSMINSQSAQYGRLYGSICYRVAFRLFDGSYVMHSIPQYLLLGGATNPGSLIVTKGSGDSYQYRWTLPVGAIAAQFDPSEYTTEKYENMKDIVDSVVVFATKATPRYLIDDTTVTETKLTTSFSNLVGSHDPYLSNFPTNPDFDSLVDSEGWYKILEIDFRDIVGNTGGTMTKMADTKGFYQDYATRRALTTDQYSHHQILAKSPMTYNDRLHILGVKTLFETPSVFVDPVTLTQYSLSGFRDGVITVYLSTGLGKVVLVNNGDDEANSIIPYYINNSTGRLYYLQPSIIGYPDARATKIEMAVRDFNNDLKPILSVELKANDSGNFAYAKSDTEYALKWIHEDLPNVANYVTPAVQLTGYDQNRLQVSEIQNPLVFPAKYSYQIGLGKGICMATASEPLSAGQFGQYPVICFMSDGRYALQQGSGDILYASIQPIDGEVADNPLNVIGVDSGIVYSTQRGLYMAQGMEKVRISIPVEGKPVTQLTGGDEIDTLTTDTKFTPELDGSLSEDNFLEYLDGSSVGYDHVNKELVVSNPSKGYSYLYSFENKIWYKMSGSFSLLINSYPELLAISGNKVYNLSRETTGNVPVLIVTNALNLDLPDVYKKIESLIVRAGLTTPEGKYAGLYLFGTNDIATYQILTGRQRSGTGLKDLLIQRSPGSCKFYVVVINGVISFDSSIQYVDIVAITRLTNRLR